MSKSDPMCVLSQQDANGNWVKLGHTEWQVRFVPPCTPAPPCTVLTWRVVLSEKREKPQVRDQAQDGVYLRGQAKAAGLPRFFYAGSSSLCRGDADISVGSS
eukprot:3794621-Rhodomonas_salina.1